MVLNTVAVNARLTTGYGTGDLNGPTLVWVDAGLPSGIWTHTPATVSVARGLAINGLAALNAHVVRSGVVWPGDVNGPSHVWATVEPGGSAWTAATEPVITAAADGTFLLLLALINGGHSASGEWTDATEPSVATWAKETV